MAEYNSAVFTLTNVETPDPFIVSALGRFFLIYTAGDRIEVHASDNLANFRRASRHVLWKPPRDTEYSDGLWAPELHAVGGRWYVYFAAGHPKFGNKSHRMWVLGGPSADQDPTMGPWQFLGPVQGMPPQQWAIDGTIFELYGSLYFVYSGWPFDNRNESDLNQQLFIMKMANPTQGCSQPVMISRAEHRFEISTDQNGDHGIQEGPQFLAAPNGSWCGIVYSCAGSWTKDYKMNVLNYRGGDPLNPASWQKDTQPLCQNHSSGRGPFGPGHGNFITLGNDTVAVFHAADGPTDGWANRKARMQRVVFTQHGPSMGGHVGVLTSNMETFTKGNGSDTVPASSKQGVRAFFHDAKVKLREL